VLTVRALAAGLLVGAVLCFSNTYFGLQTGWVTMGSLQVRATQSWLLGCRGRCEADAAGCLSRTAAQMQTILLSLHSSPAMTCIQDCQARQATRSGVLTVFPVVAAAAAAQSAILGYGLFQGLSATGLLTRHLNAAENVIVQTTAGWSNMSIVMSHRLMAGLGCSPPAGSLTRPCLCNKCVVAAWTPEQYCWYCTSASCIQECMHVPVSPTPCSRHCHHAPGCWPRRHNPSPGLTHRRGATRGPCHLFPRTGADSPSLHGSATTSDLSCAVCLIVAS
jgi:hypothetical protein